MNYYVVEYIDNEHGVQDEYHIFNELPSYVIGLILTETSPSTEQVLEVITANFNPSSVKNLNIRPHEDDDDYLHVTITLDGLDEFFNVYEVDEFGEV